ERYMNSPRDKRNSDFEVITPRTMDELKRAVDANERAKKRYEDAVKNGDKTAKAPKKLVLDVDVVLLTGPAGMTGTDFRLHTVQFGDVTNLSSSGYDQWAGRAGRAIGPGEYYT